jgi:hypothetical protein
MTTAHVTAIMHDAHTRTHSAALARSVPPAETAAGGDFNVQPVPYTVAPWHGLGGPIGPRGGPAGALPFPVIKR